MSKVIKCKLDVDSLQNAIDELKEYRDSINDKLQQFVAALLEDGVIGFGINADGDIVTATISLEGSDALFIEFGAGIAYNTGMQHPYAGEFGYGVGTYPSKHPPNKAMNPGYWYYRENGELVKSIGTQASMPIYHAAETMRNIAIQKAIEIFRS